MKNEAWIDGQKCAQRHVREIIVASEQWWNTRMEQYASGHFSTSSARKNFCDGWKSVTPPPFIFVRKVTLQVRLMNVTPVKENEGTPLEKEMLHVFHVFDSMSSITFIKVTDICLTYRIETTIDGLSHLPIVQFLQKQLVSYKVLTEQVV
jgi:hypothetical protein